MRPLIIIVYIFFTSCATTSIAQEKDKVNHSKYEMELFNNEITKYGLSDGDTLLDIGSGFGFEDAILFRFYPNIFFVLEDIDNKFSKLNNSYVLINGNKKYFKNNSKYVNGFIDSIPLLSNNYNIILCRKTVHEFANLDRMINEIKRLLTKDGILIIEEAIPKSLNDIDPYCKKRHLSKQELMDAFTVNGFGLISADTTTMTLKNVKDANMNILKFKKNTSS